jgi:hypothetical protein
MSKMKDIDLIIKDIGDVLYINPRRINLFQTTTGYGADVSIGGKTIEGNICVSPKEALYSLLQMSSEKFPNINR